MGEIERTDAPLVVAPPLPAADRLTIEHARTHRPRRGALHYRRRGWLVRRILAMADVVGLVSAFVFSQLLFERHGTAIDVVGPFTEVLLFLLTLPLWIVVARQYGLYAMDEERTDHSTVDDFVGVLNMVTLGTWLFLAATRFTDLVRPSIPRLFFFWSAAVALVPACRALARAWVRRTMTYQQNTLILGAGDIGQLVAKKLLQHPEYGLNLLGFVDATPKERRLDLGDLTILGTPGELVDLVRALGVERLIVAFSADSHTELLELVRAVGELDVQVDIVPRLFEALGPHVSVHTIEGLSVIGLPAPRLSRSALVLKRELDLVLSAVALVVLSPVLIAIAVAIKLDSRGPVFFRQVRSGAGRTFRIFKFRTMAVDAEKRKHEVAHLNKHLGAGGDPRMFKVPDDPRATRVGRFLRRYSLDELPQLLNVLRGEMSLVGPRPLILEEDSHVGGRSRRRLDLKPGMTGLWQVLGRDDIPFEEMVELDYRYVTTWTLTNDLKLMFRTLPILTRPRASC